MVVLKIILGLDWTTWDHGVYVYVGYGLSLSSCDVGRGLELGSGWGNRCVRPGPSSQSVESGSPRPHGPMLRCAQARPITVFGQSVFSEGGKGSKQEAGNRWDCVLGEMSCGHTTDFEGGSSDWAPCLEGPKLVTSVHLVLLRLLQQITVEGGEGG